MMKFLRSQSQTVLVVVLGVLGLGFLFYGNAGNLLTSSAGHASNDYGSIDREDLSMAQLYDAVRLTRYSVIIQGHSQDLTQRGAAAQIAEEAWGQLLLLHEADRLHIDVSDKQLIDLIHSSPGFQKDGVYSPEVYTQVMAQLKDALRLPSEPGVDAIANTKAVYETIMRNNLRASAVSNALFTTVRSSARGLSDQYEKYYGPATVSFISFDPKSFADAAQVTPADIEAEYKAHPDNPAYRTSEKRKVDYVLFLLSPDQTKLSDKEKAAAKDALGEKALNFALAFQPDPSATPGVTPPPAPDFLTEAKKQGLTPATTDFFTVDTPPANVPPSPSFNNAAFSLAKDNTISKVVELENGVAILHLAEIQPSDLKSLDEVKADITKQLRELKGQQAEKSAAQNAAAALQAAVAKGTDFKAAAASLKLKVETVPVFVPYKTLEAGLGLGTTTVTRPDPRLQTIAAEAIGLAPGQVSDPVPMESDNSSLVLHLDNRAKADQADWAQFEPRFRNSEDNQLRKQVYTDWVNWKSKQPGTHKPPDLDAYGTVE